MRYDSYARTSIPRLSQSLVLMQAGADVNLVDVNDNTGLIEVTICGHLQCVKREQM